MVASTTWKWSPPAWEDYYLGGGEAPSYWTGTATHLLDLAGQVHDAALRAVLADAIMSRGPFTKANIRR